jgi:lysine 6-dehydrogenase
MKIAVLGGAGLMGPGIIRDLTAAPQISQITVGDLDSAAAQRLVEEMPGSKLHAAAVDVRDAASVDAVLRDADACVNAVQYYFNLDVMRACLRTQTPYVDLGGLFHVTRQQMDLSAAFAENGLSAILGLGSSPGVSNVAAACAAEELETIESIHLYNASDTLEDDPLGQVYSIRTILDEITEEPVVFSGGEFGTVAPLSGQEIFQFLPPVGYRKVHHSLHSELATLPHSYRDRGVQEVSFKIAFFGYSEEALNKLKLLADLDLGSDEPLEVGDVVVRPRDVLVALQRRRASQMSKAEPAEPQGYKNVAAVVAGRQDGQAVTVRLDALATPHAAWGVSGSNVMVTSPAAIGAVWLAEGRIDKPGVHPPETVIPPREFFAALAERGVQTTLTRTTPL